MVFDIVLIASGIMVLYLLEQVPYLLKRLENFRLHVENERLDVYIKLQSLCLNSTFTGGDASHDVLIFLSERYPTLPFWYVMRIIFDRKYRAKREHEGRKFAEHIKQMPQIAQEIIETLRCLDIKLVFVRQPVAFCLLSLFLFCRIVLHSDPKPVANAGNELNDLLIQSDTMKQALAA